VRVRGACQRGERGGHRRSVVAPTMRSTPLDFGDAFAFACTCSVLHLLYSDCVPTVLQPCPVQPSPLSILAFPEILLYSRNAVCSVPECVLYSVLFRRDACLPQIPTPRALASYCIIILHRTDTLYPQRSIASTCILAATLIFAGWAGRM
jgi:hypothetical protein